MKFSALQSFGLTTAATAAAFAVIGLWSGASEYDGNVFANTPLQVFGGAVVGVVLWLTWKTVAFVAKVCSIASMAVDRKRESMMRERAERW